MSCNFDNIRANVNGTFDCVQGYPHYLTTIGLIAGIVIILFVIALIVERRAKK